MLLSEHSTAVPSSMFLSYFISFFASSSCFPILQSNIPFPLSTVFSLHRVLPLLSRTFGLFFRSAPVFLVAFFSRLAPRGEFEH